MDKIEEIYEEMHNAEKRELTTEETKIIVAAINADKSGEVPREVDEIWEYRAINKYLDAMNITMTPMAIILFIAIFESIGMCVMMLGYVKWVCSKIDCSVVDVKTMCEEIMPHGVIPLEELNKYYYRIKDEMGKFRDMKFEIEGDPLMERKIVKELYNQGYKYSGEDERVVKKGCAIKKHKTDRSFSAECSGKKFNGYHIVTYRSGDITNVPCGKLHRKHFDAIDHPIVTFKELQKRRRRNNE